MREFHATLNEVPWRTVGSQQGKCEHVPDAIEALLSPDAGLRKAGYWRLDNCLVVQGGLFDGAFYVVPFLLQICRSEDLNGKVESLDLLIEIASGAASYDKTIGFRAITHPFRHYVPSPDEPRIPLAVACRYAIAAEFDALLDCTVSQDDVVRKKMHELVLRFPEYAYASAEVLRDIAASHAVDSEIRNALHRTINELGA
jgi:hypothetical protein